MEPVTHFLTGACIGRAGLNRKTACATLVGTLAAEAADLDMFWAIRGPVDELKHHRGITHTFIAAPVVALIIVLFAALIHRWQEQRRTHRRLAAQLDPDAPIPLRLQPTRIHWGWLYLTGLLAALSHILLDWTTTYGVRPFFPFNPHWYEGGFIFIAEPILWALLLAAMIVPGLLGLVAGEIGARRKPFRGRGWAIFALLGMVLLWGWRWAEQAHALALVQNQQIASAPVRRAVALPYPVNPFHWHVVVETPAFYQMADVNTRSGDVESDPQRDVLYKPPFTPAVEAAQRTFLGQVYLDWATWALVTDLGQDPIATLPPPQLPPNRQWTTVQFIDLRFDYSFLGTGRSVGRPPLSGEVYIVDGHENAGEVLNGKEQRAPAF